MKFEKAKEYYKDFDSIKGILNKCVYLINKYNKLPQEQENMFRELCVSKNLTFIGSFEEETNNFFGLDDAPPLWSYSPGKKEIISEVNNYGEVMCLAYVTIETYIIESLKSKFELVKESDKYLLLCLIEEGNLKTWYERCYIGICTRLVVLSNEIDEMEKYIIALDYLNKEYYRIDVNEFDKSNDYLKGTVLEARISVNSQLAKLNKYSVLGVTEDIKSFLYKYKYCTHLYNEHYMDFNLNIASFDLDTFDTLNNADVDRHPKYFIVNFSNTYINEHRDHKGIYQITMFDNIKQKKKFIDIEFDAKNDEGKFVSLVLLKGRMIRNNMMKFTVIEFLTTPKPKEEIIRLKNSRIDKNSIDYVILTESIGMPGNKDTENTFAQCIESIEYDMALRDCYEEYDPNVDLEQEDSYLEEESYDPYCDEYDEDDYESRGYLNWKIRNHEEVIDFDNNYYNEDENSTFYDEMIEAKNGIIESMIYQVWNIEDLNFAINTGLKDGYDFHHLYDALKRLDKTINPSTEDLEENGPF